LLRLRLISMFLFGKGLHSSVMQTIYQYKENANEPNPRLLRDT